MKTEVLQCYHCQKLAISIDNVRQTTTGERGHGSSKCAGQWRVLAASNGGVVEEPSSPKHQPHCRATAGFTCSCVKHHSIEEAIFDDAR